MSTLFNEYTVVDVSYAESDSPENMTRIVT